LIIAPEIAQFKIQRATSNGSKENKKASAVEFVTPFAIIKMLLEN